MDLMTVTQQTGAQGLGGNRSATIKPRYCYRALNWLRNKDNFLSIRRNHLLLDGDVRYDTVSRDYKGDKAFKAKLEKPR